MSKIYLPTSEQMDTTIGNLERIAGALGSKTDVSTWAGVQRAVKSGVAQRLFPVGTRFTVPHSVYGNIVFDVVAHNHFKSAHDENAHTMTLMAHDQIDAMPFDSAEAFYYASGGLEAGTYNFTLGESFQNWTAGTYQFTLTKEVPYYGQLCISGDASAAITESQMVVYASQTATEASESVAISAGNGGTSIDSLTYWSTNHIHRVSNGSNNYRDSSIRQFLNSTAEAGKVWIPMTKYDRPPNWVTAKAGFANGLDDEFLSIVGEVIVPCSENDLYEDRFVYGSKGEKYTVVDKFYLASQKELFGTAANTVDDGSVVFKYYEGAANTDRIKNRDGSPALWWTRTPNQWDAYIVRIVHKDGSVSNGTSKYNVGCVPVCTIV